MALIERLVVGFVRGMGGPDIDKWLDDMPAQAGRAIGGVLKKHVGKDRILSDEGAEELTVLLKDQPLIASQAVSGMLIESSDSSILPLYVEILNLIVEALRSNERPLLIQGFLHNEEVLSYWSFSGSSENMSNFKLSYSDAPMLTMGYNTPIISLLARKHIARSSNDLNTEIRKNKDQKLPDSYLEGSTAV